MRLLLIAALALTSAAWAASPEESYIAAREAAITKIKKLEAKKGAEAAVLAEEKKALADLEMRLRGLIGDLSVKGFTAKGEINLCCLRNADIRYRELDALEFVSAGCRRRIVVTNDALLDSWLRTQEWGKKHQKTPPDANSALQSDSFYREVLPIGDLTKSAVIPIDKPDGAAFAFAMLGAYIQEDDGSEPNEIMVALRQGGKVFITSTPPKAKITKIPACEKVRKDSQIKVEKVNSAYRAGGYKNEKLDELTRIEKKGGADFRACFNERAPREAFFAAMTREAQALVDQIAKR